MNKKPDNLHELLWTGGWDSSYRLLELLLIHKEPVKAHYIVFNQRQSTQYELNAIHNIIKILNEKYPKQAQLLSPLEITLDVDIPRHSETHKAYQCYNQSHKKIGMQYPVLSDYCQYKKLTKLELSVEKSTSPSENYLTDSLLQHAEFVPTKHFYLLSNPPEDLALFTNMAFPLLDTTKSDMLNIAKKHNFDRLLLESWFCHKPKTGKPCGVCGPCNLAISENMTWRVPLKNRILRPIRLGYINLKKNLKKRRRALKQRIFAPFMNKKT